MATRPQYQNRRPLIPGRPIDVQAQYPVEKWTSDALNSIDNTKQSVGTSSLENVRTVSASYAIQTTDEVLLADASGGNLTLTLPDAATIGQSYRVKKTDASANTVTLLPISAALIDGDTSQTIGYPHTAVDIISDGTNWSLF